MADFIRVKILDDDVDFKSLLPQNINNTLDDDIGDDNPAVAEFVDERPQHVKELERFRQSKQWKLVSHKPGTVPHLCIFNNNNNNNMAPLNPQHWTF